jgi:hypothetical protein
MFKFNSTILNQVLQYIKRSAFENKVSKYNADKGTSVLHCFAILVIMIFTQYSKKDKLRAIQDAFSVNSNCMYHLDLKTVRRSSLSDALKTRNHKVFEEHFFHLLEELKLRNKKKYRKQIKILDSTTIGLCKSLFDWADFRKSKAGIKIHILFDDKLNVPVDAIMTNAKVHDVNVAKKITIEKGQVYVFDRGYNDYDYWYKIHKNKAFFVTRLKKNVLYSIKKHGKTGNKTGVIADKIIKIKGTNSDSYDEELRMIEYYDETTDKRFKFITNNFKMKAEEIADIYKRRWQIELFFKWLKGHFKIKKFLSTSENGVKIQIWCALIAYILLLLIKKDCIKNISIYEILRIIESCLFSRINLFDAIDTGQTNIIFNNKNLQLELKLW